MKKLFIAVIILAICVGGGFYLSKRYTHEKKVEAVRANVWQIDKIGVLNVEGMALDNDTLLTEALDALLTKKVNEGELTCDIDLQISDTETDLSEIKNLLVRISKGATSINDTLKISQKGNHQVQGTLEFNVANIEPKSDNPEQVLQFVRELYKQEDLKFEVCPNIEDIEPEWMTAQISTR